MAMDRIVALASAVSVAAIAVNTIHEFINFVEEKQRSNNTSLFSRQQSLPRPPASNNILSRPSIQALWAMPRTMCEGSTTITHQKLASAEFAATKVTPNGIISSVRVTLGSTMKEV